MGSRLAKPPPPNRGYAPQKGKGAQFPRPFPPLTPQSYLPGGAGAGFYPGQPGAGGPNQFPMLGPNSYLPPRANDPPIMNFGGATGLMPPPSPYPPGFPQPGPMRPPPMPYPNPGAMSMVAPPPPPYCDDPGLRSMSRRPVRICRRRRRRRCSRRSRPVIRIIESSSCSSLSSCSTVSLCSRRRCRSHSHQRRCDAPSAPAPQQPIILLPVPMQQSQPNVSTPAPNQIQQQPQQIILPPLQVSQSGPFQQPLSIGGLPMQQQLALPPIQFGSSNVLQSAAPSPIIIPSGQPLPQSSTSLPQIVSVGQTQPIRSQAIQYVQAAPRSSSPLNYVKSGQRSTIAPQRVLVNSTNRKQSKKSATVGRSASVRDLPQNDLKYGRHPFDWYGNEKKNQIVNEKIQVGQRGSTAAR